MINSQNDNTSSAGSAAPIVRAAQESPARADDAAGASGAAGAGANRYPLGRQMFDRLRRGRKPRLGAILMALVAVVSLATGFRACNCNRAWTEVSAAATPEANPLKGMMPFAPADASHSPALQDNAPPHTMEWQTLPVSDVVTGPGSYAWDKLDAHLDAIASRGHQAVLRFYVDYPGRPSGIPAYLLSSHAVPTHEYTFNGNAPGQSLAPDYNDPEMMSMLTGFVSALGQQYDGDPRLAFITHGLVGFWGEGHTYPMNGKVSGENPSGENWMPSTANQNTLVDTWDGAFQVTPTLARYPSAETVKRGVGYHDDSFGYATMDTADWHFLPKLKEAKADQAWQQHPIGGEVYPGIQECSVRNPGSCMASGSNGGTVDINASIKATHASWLVDNWAFTTTLNGSERERTVQASAETGYDLAVARWRMRNGKVEVQIANNGVAPFYYNWNVEAVAINTSNGMEVGRTTLSGDLRKVAVGKTQTFSGQLPADPAGQNTILVRVVNPLDSGQPLRFSSAGQDQTLPGYLTLGRTPTK